MSLGHFSMDSKKTGSKQTGLAELKRQNRYFGKPETPTFDSLRKQSV
jgi:hypothetical protein